MILRRRDTCTSILVWKFPLFLQDFFHSVTLYDLQLTQRNRTHSYQQLMSHFWVKRTVKLWESWSIGSASSFFSEPLTLFVRLLLISVTKICLTKDPCTVTNVAKYRKIFEWAKLFTTTCSYSNPQMFSKTLSFQDFPVICFKEVIRFETYQFVLIKTGGYVVTCEVHSSGCKWRLCLPEVIYFGKIGHTGKIKFPTGGLSSNYVSREQKAVVWSKLVSPPKWDYVGVLNSSYSTTTVIKWSVRRICFYHYLEVSQVLRTRTNHRTFYFALFDPLCGLCNERSRSLLQ